MSVTLVADESAPAVVAEGVGNAIDVAANVWEERLVPPFVRVIRRANTASPATAATSTAPAIARPVCRHTSQIGASTPAHHARRSTLDHAAASSRLLRLSFDRIAAAGDFP